METMHEMSMTFEQFCRVQQYQQRLKAKASFTKADKAKTTLTKLELLNKWAQMGKIVRHNNTIFTFESGMGCINDNGKVTIGATISDFIKLAKVTI